MTNRIIGTRSELISLLNGARATFAYGFFIEHLVRRFADPGVEARASGNFQFEDRAGATSIKLSVLGEQLATFETEIRGNYFLMIEHYAARTFYELVKTYCEESKQVPKYVAEPFMQYARVLRNVVSHGNGAMLTQWPNNLSKKKIFEVSWRSRKIAQSQVGTLIPIDVVDLVHLQDDIYAFAQGLS